MTDPTEIRLRNLERLKRLRDEGVLSEEEFRRERADVFRRNPIEKLEQDITDEAFIDPSGIPEPSTNTAPEISDIDYDTTGYQPETSFANWILIGSLVSLTIFFAAAAYVYWGTGQTPGETYQVTARALNCRAEPTTTSRVVTQFTQGGEISVTDRQDGWLKVDTDDECWVSGRYAQKRDNPIATRRRRPRLETAENYSSRENIDIQNSFALADTIAEYAFMLTRTECDNNIIVWSPPTNSAHRAAIYELHNAYIEFEREEEFVSTAEKLNEPNLKAKLNYNFYIYYDAIKMLAETRWGNIPYRKWVDNLARREYPSDKITINIYNENGLNVAKIAYSRLFSDFSNNNYQKVINDRFYSSERENFGFLNCENSYDPHFFQNSISYERRDTPYELFIKSFVTNSFHIYGF